MTRPAPKFASESDFQREAIKALRSRGYWVVRRGYKARRGGSNTRPLAGEPGEPDLELRPLGHLELKLPGEALTPAQIEWHRWAKLIGLRVWTVDTISEALEVADRWLAESGVSREALFRVDRERRQRKARK